jgi:tetratricopeptide (TPR) repeat protein
LELRQVELALKDLDAALILRPEALDALLARAELRINQHENQGARADLDAAVKASTAQSDERFTIAMLYQRIDELELAAAQLDQWITAHPQELKRAAAYTQRCWDRALLGQDLRKALDDCSQALRAAPESAGAYDGRGLIRLRMGEYKPSINDYDTALKLQPKIAWCLYGRGLDRLYMGQTEQGEVDIAAAVELVSDIATRASKFGIAPPASASGSR